MPDREDGVHHWKNGPMPKSDEMARAYRNHQREPAATLTRRVQKLIVDELIRSAAKQRFELYVVACDADHLHILIAWRDERPAATFRRSIKSSITRRLNDDVQQRKWLAQGGSVVPVEDEDHLEFLHREYLPKHAGWCWDRKTGWRPPMRSQP
ncbi:MAG: transposase [Planctomycetota bacterium]